jgi:prefoldin subunit 5
MKSVDRNSQYYNRLLNKLNEQETDIETRQTELDTLHKTLESQRADLEKYVNNLNIG